MNEYNYDEYYDDYYNDYNNSLYYENEDCNRQEYYVSDETLLVKRFFSFGIDIIFSSIIHFIFVFLFVNIRVPYITTSKVFYELIMILVASFSINFIIIPSFLFNGQTIGKKILKIKTLKENGHPISFWDNMIRFAFVILILIDIIYFLIYKTFLHNRITNTLTIDV